MPDYWFQKRKKGGYLPLNWKGWALYTFAIGMVVSATHLSTNPIIVGLLAMVFALAGYKLMDYKLAPENEIVDGTKGKKLGTVLMGGVIGMVGAFAVFAIVLTLEMQSQPNSITALKKTEEYFSSPGWKTFTSIGGQFQIKLPSYPSTSTSTIPETVDNAPGTITTYKSKDANGDDYGVAYVPFPSTIDISNPQARLEASLNGMLAGENGTLLSSNLSTYEGYPDINALIQAQGYYVTARVIVANRTEYIVEMVSSATTTNFDTFGNSLHFNFASSTTQ